MKTIIGIFKSTCFWSLALVFLSMLLPEPSWSLNINDHQVPPLAVKVHSKITYPDGTPLLTDGEVLKAHLLEYPPGFWKEIEILQENGKPFKMKNAPAPAYTKLTAFPTADGRKFSDLGEFRDGVFFLTIPYPGRYALRLMGMDVVEFHATPDDSGGLDVDLPERVIAPFNYLIKTEPQQAIKMIDLNSGSSIELTADDEGLLPIKESSRMKAYAIIGEGLLPVLDVFSERSGNSVGRLSYRTLSLKPRVPTARLKAPIHNMTTDLYYWYFKKKPKKDGPDYFFLASYDGKSKKSWVKRVSLGENGSRVGSMKLLLDDKGQAEVAVGWKGGKGEAAPGLFSIDSELGLSPIDDPYYPAYRFKGHTIQGTRWQIPTLMRIPLNEGGGNSISVDCQVDFMTEIAAEEAYAKHVQGVLKGFYPQCFREEPDPSCGDNLLGNCRYYNEDCKKALREPPPTAQGTTSASGTSSFSVVYDRETKTYKFDPEEIFPDPYEELKKVYRSLETKKCTIRVNGYGPFPYSYREIPPNIGLSCSDLVTVSEGEPQIVKTRDGRTREIRIPVQERVFDEECLRNLQKSLDSYPVIMGFEGEGSPMGVSVNLIDPNRRDFGRLSGPINSREGPHSSLIYTGKRVVAEFPTREAARGKCKSPSRKSKRGKSVYVCEENFTLGVCPQKYSFSFTDSGMQVDYDAMYGGDCQTDPEYDGPVDFQVKVEAEGFEPLTDELSTGTLSPSNIVMHGIVKDSGGNKIAGARVSLPGFGVLVESDDKGRYHVDAYVGGAERFELERDLILRQKISQVEVFTEDPGSDRRIYANGRSGTLRFQVLADGRPYAGKEVRVMQTAQFFRLVQVGDEVVELPTDLVTNLRTQSPKTMTNQDGWAEVVINGPRLYPGKIAPEADSRRLFPLRGYVRLRGDWDSSMEVMTPYPVFNPVPVITKVRLVHGVEAGQWQIKPSRIWFEDPDSKLSSQGAWTATVQAPGDLKVRYKHTTGKELYASGVESPFEFHYRPKIFGFDLNDQPKLGMELLDTNMKALRSVLLSVLENDLLKAPAVNKKGSTIWIDGKAHQVHTKQGSIFHDFSNMQKKGKTWNTSQSVTQNLSIGNPTNKAFMNFNSTKILQGKINNKAIAHLAGGEYAGDAERIVNLYKHGITALDRAVDEINRQEGAPVGTPEHEKVFAKIDYALNMAETVLGLAGLATHNTYTEVAKGLWANAKVIYSAYRKYEDINDAVQDVTQLPIVITIEDELGYSTRKVVECDVTYWSKAE